jgi:hypothetical protein
LFALSFIIRYILRGGGQRWAAMIIRAGTQVTAKTPSFLLSAFSCCKFFLLPAPLSVGHDDKFARSFITAPVRDGNAARLYMYCTARARRDLSARRKRDRNTKRRSTAFECSQRLNSSQANAKATTI